MKSLQETMNMLLDKMDEANFIVSRNSECIGEAVGIVVKDRYISIIKSSTDIAVGDVLTDRSTATFTVTEVSVVDSLTRVYFSKTG